MKQDEIEQLKAEIDHIFESGANEIRILNTVKTFIERRYESNHLLSKKPSVSDEEIERMASKYNLYRDEIRPFISGATAFRDTYYLPQSEVSDIAKLIEKYDNIHSCGECGEPRFSEFVHEFKQLNSLTPPDAEKWISVDEKPKEDIHCLVFLYNPNTNDSWQETAYTLEGYFHGVMGKQEYITHWMPLPKPPINKQGGK